MTSATTIRRRGDSAASKQTPQRLRSRVVPSNDGPERHRQKVVPQRKQSTRELSPLAQARAKLDVRVTAIERSNARTPFIMLVLGLVVAGMVGLVLLNTAINEEAFELHKLDRDKKSMDLRERQLERDVAELESAGALHAAAKREHLVDAGPPAFIDLESGEVLGVPKPAGS